MLISSSKFGRQPTLNIALRSLVYRAVVHFHLKISHTFIDPISYYYTITLSMRKSGRNPFVRSLGLTAILSIIVKLFHGSKRGELKKIALRRNRWYAAQRCAIHIIPCVPSIVVASLNIRGYYIGGELTGHVGEDGAKLGALQLAAKFHELSINASIAAMVISYIRYQLVSGVGIPFGALLASFHFTELSYLWSMEFWGAVLSRKVFHVWYRRVPLIAVLITAIILAATAAPASAIAIIPRLDLWPACGTSFWINATQEDMWPSIVNQTHIYSDMCLSEDAIDDLSCPSGGYHSIKAFSTYLQKENRGFGYVPGRALPAFGPHVTRNMNLTLKLGRNSDYITTATVPQSALAGAMTISGLWWPSAAKFAWERFKQRYWFNQDSLVSADTIQPISRVQCSDFFVRSGNLSSILRFPVDFSTDEIRYKDLVNSTDQRILDDAAQKNAVGSSLASIYWHTLPTSSFTNSTMGAVIVLPFDPNAEAVSYVTCNIDSRWAPGSMWSYHMANTGNVYGAPSDVPLEPGQTIQYALGHTFSDWQWPSIAADFAWANALIVPVQNPGTANQTNTFTSIAATAGIDATSDPSHILVIEAVLAMQFADALARISSTATLQGTLKGGGSPNGAAYGPWVDEYMRHGDAYELDASFLDASAHWIHPRVEVAVFGFAYSMKGWTIKVAICILLAHVAFAFVHTMYTIWVGVDSGCWDSITEMLALAVNSSQTVALSGTCAGIERIGTMGMGVKIIETGGRGDHLELRFGVEGEEKTPLFGVKGSVDDGEVRVDKAYGELDLLG